MKFTDERTITPAARELRRRILDVLPAGGYQLHRLFQLFDIEVTDAVPTAAVTLGGDARLQVNPGFVARHCATDEALFVLVLHELLHVVLGHTRQFRRATWAQNVAFDAVINAMIARSHPQPEFVSFLTSINGWDTFPGRLLRPPPGWPHAPEPLPPDASDDERRVHGRLYGGDSGDTTYHEIFVLLTKKLSKREGGVAVLLGGHEGEAVDTRIDATLHEVLEDHVRMWPAPMRAAALDRGGPAADLQLAAEQEADRRLERALRDVFARAGIGDGRGLRRPGPEIVPTTSIGVLPSFTDRRAATRRAVLGRPPIFWEAPATRCVRGRVPAPRAFVYLDVSGSMDAFLRALRPALARPVRDGAARLFAFSTEVHEVDVRTFGRKGTRSTGGTDGNAVFSHLLALPARQRPRAIVLVTDGWIGKVDATLAARLRELRIDVHVALAPDGFRKDLASLGATIHDLPAPGSAARPAGRGHRRRA